MSIPSLFTKWSELPLAHWMDRAACKGKDPATFFPPNGHNLLTRPAFETCNSCPVQLECLNYALDHNIDHGIWGGTSERERVRIRRGRRALHSMGLDKDGLRLAQDPLSPPESSHG